MLNKMLIHIMKVEPSQIFPKITLKNLMITLAVLLKAIHVLVLLKAIHVLCVNDYICSFIKSNPCVNDYICSFIKSTSHSLRHET
jgi:hypothetical protein